METQSNYTKIRLDVMEDGEGTLSCTEKGYAFVTTKAGVLLVSCDDIKPHGDGYKVVMRIGNPHAITFDGFNVKLRYGRRQPGDYTQYANWEKSIQTREMRLTDTLRSGAWNRVEMILAPAKADETGFLGLSIVVDRVSLRM